MNVRLKYFAIVRESLGRSSELRDAEEGTTAGSLLDELTEEAPRLASMRNSIMLMVNQEYVDANYVLQDGDEFALIPPVSGGQIASEGRLFRVQEGALDPREVEQIVASSSAGAVVTFTGSVRDNARGLTVSALEYESYAPAAEKMMERIANEILERWGISRVAIVHRVGLLKVGEASVVIAISSAHRDEAFDASRYAIVRLKEIVPVWKKEFYEDGATWIGSEVEYQRESGRLISITGEPRAT